MKFKAHTPITLILSFWLVAGMVLFTGSPAFADRTYTVSGPAKRLNLPEVVAKVNGVDVPSHHVNFEFNRVIRSNPNPLDDKQEKLLVAKIIDSEITREMVFQNAKEAGTTFDKKEVDESYDVLRKQFSTEKAWKSALDARGIDEKILRHSIEMDLMARKFLESKVQGLVKITDTQVKNFYDENKARFKRPESYRSQHIFIAYVPAEKRMKMKRDELKANAEKLRDEAKVRMDKVMKELKAGGDFSELAKKYSEDAGSAEKGGDLGFVYKGMLDKQYDAAVAKLKPGEVSPVVESPYGFHVIKLNETKPSEMAKFEEVKGSVQNHLFTEEAKKIVSSHINVMRKKAKVELLYKP
ncbi:MAG: hypothetical protein G3M70_01430 [Candidatus Nitronauta litoralis]|uniref:PpiC domain-containing protein n=1 Tax=Candidatus Nitronauta litoralis TaxID=2705533 RepID=A0A7T0BTB1_9BACT|nr:MAG: hypothetical protein G3M70_01430 [Candidatus Nitronauta litoralis]